MSSLISHAEEELQRLVGGPLMFPEREALELVKCFARQGHSGDSAAHTLSLFTKLAERQPLTPLTPNPDEWEDVSDKAGHPLWQSTRSSTAFSVDGGKTFYVLQEDGTPGPTHTIGARPSFTNPESMRPVIENALTDMATKSAQRSGETKEN